MASVVQSTRKSRYRVVAGVGAGAGAALVMMLAMAVLRFVVGVPSVPELMLGPILRMLGGQAFSAAIDTLYYAGRPLLLTLILEGTLLLGALLGLLYAWLARRNATTGRRPAIFAYSGGVLYGLAIGVLLNVVFLPLLGEPPFATRASEVYSTSPVPLWLGLMLLALVYGITLEALLPKSAQVVIAEAPSTPVDAIDLQALHGSHDRRQFLRIAGGTLVALAGGGLFWYGGTVVNQGGFTSPVDVRQPDDVASADEVSDLGSGGEIVEPEPVAQVKSTATPRPTDTAQPTDTPEPPPTGTPEPAATSTATQEPLPSSTPEPLPTDTPAPPTNTPEPPTPTPVPTTPPPPPPTRTPAPPAPVQIAVRELTPVGSFYNVSKNFVDPSPLAGVWRLQVKGMVGKPYSLTYNDLIALPAVEVVVGMMCISNPVGGGLIGNQTWKGVRLADLLNRAAPKPGVVDVLLTAEDGYSDSFSYKKAIDPNVVLAWEMGGQPLTPQHGFPARLLVPGIYGMKHVKWLSSIELVGYDYKGYWQQPSQGWSDPAPVHTMSRIDYPAGTVQRKTQVIGGIAFAGDRSISKVEVSTDGGNTWHQAYLKPPMSGTSWAIWGYEWTPAKAGKRTLQVRAIDGQGNLQSSKITDPYPNGATGYHTVSVIVK